jgi:hypothetical protein
MIYEETRGVLKTFLEGVIRDAVTYTEHAKRELTPNHYLDALLTLSQARLSPPSMLSTPSSAKAALSTVSVDRILDPAFVRSSYFSIYQSSVTTSVDDDGHMIPLIVYGRSSSLFTGGFRSSPFIGIHIRHRQAQHDLIANSWHYLLIVFGWSSMLFTAGVSENLCTSLPRWLREGWNGWWFSMVHAFLLFRRLGGLLVWTWASGGRDLRDETLTAMTAHQ